MSDDFVTCRHCGVGINYRCDHEDDDVPAEEHAATLAQLPEGMKHCTIVYNQCPVGHGWLTATDWMPVPCPWCALAASEAAVESERRWAKEYHDDWQRTEVALRAAMGHADALRLGSISWRERAWKAEAEQKEDLKEKLAASEERARRLEEALRGLGLWLGQFHASINLATVVQMRERINAALAPPPEAEKKGGDRG